jgi:Enterochelin esterase and related enzymes
MRCTTIIIFLLLVIGKSGFSQDKIIFTEIRPPYNTVSPIVEKLQKVEPENLPGEVNKLWVKLQSEGAPLIERDPMYDDYVYMTFFYRESTANKNIGFDVFGTYDEYRFGDMKLYRLRDTDLFYRCYMMPDDICFSYRFTLSDTLTGEKQVVTDPLNTNLSPAGERNRYSWSVLDLRTDEPDWYTKRYVDTGSRLDTFNITSKLMDNTRNIYVYLPPGYDNADRSKKYPVIYLFDSFIYLHRIEIPNMFDNLIKEGKVEPMIAVMIDNPTGISRLTELPLNPKFKDFMISELVPQIRSKYCVTDKPDKTLIGGISYGGLASTYIAYYHPDIFGKVLSQSGSFWRDLALKDYNGFEQRNDWLINKFLTEENKSLKIFLDWGLQENWCLSSARRMVRVLDKKGYTFKFVEFNGWHDWSNSRKTFPEGLKYLLAD